MKAISLFQPTVFAVCRLGQRIVNRPGWREGAPALGSARRLVGTTVLVHASLSTGNTATFNDAVASICRAIRPGTVPEGLVTLGSRRSGGLWKPAPELARGALVARALLAAVVVTKETGHTLPAAAQGLMDGQQCRWCPARVGDGDAWAEPCPTPDPWARPGIGLVFADVVPLGVPIRFRAGAGWFDVPAKVYEDESAGSAVKENALTEAVIAAMLPGDRLEEPSARPAEPIVVERQDGGNWIVRLGIGGVSLAGSPRRAMVYVRQRRRLAHEE